MEVSKEAMPSFENSISNLYGEPFTDEKKITIALSVPLQRRRSRMEGSGSRSESRLTKPHSNAPDRSKAMQR